MTPPKAKQQKQSPDDETSDSSTEQAPYKIYCDLDGVLCDFDAGLRGLCGKSPNELNLGHMWSIVASANSFYEYIPWTRDGRELWNALAPLNVDILTGVPRHYAARKEKAAWCKRELGVATNHVDMAGYQRSHSAVEGERKKGVVNVITCWSRNKHVESGMRSVLIDDRQSLARDWEMRGGIFVHHTSTERTLKQLRELGILSDPIEETKQQEQTPSKYMMSMYDTPPDTP